MRHRSPRGFTLVEVMVALAVLALIAVLGWQGIDGIVRTRDASNERLEAMLKLNTVLAQWEADLGALQATPDVPPLAFDGRTLRLTRRTDEGLQIVAWAVREGLEGTPGGRWQRWAGPPVTTRSALQEQWLRSQQLLGNEPGQITLAGGLTGWQIYFWRNNAWTNAQSSGDVESAPAAPAPAASGASAPVLAGRAREVLPGGVRLVIGFEGGATSGTLTRDVAVAPQAAL
jgi:general secretion pathway protein J